MSDQMPRDLEAAFAALRRSVAVHSHPVAASVELGVCIEIVLASAATVMGLDEAPRADTLHRKMSEFLGREVHYATFAQLRAAYDRRNLGAHRNADRSVISKAGVAASIEGVCAEIREIDRLFGPEAGYALLLRQQLESHSLEEVSRVSVLARRPGATRWVRWGAVAATVVIALVSFVVLQRSAGASALQLIESWPIGSKWVFRAETVVPKGYPDENKAAKGLIERELIAITPTPEGTILDFVERGGDDDKRERPTAWRVTEGCIESLRAKDYKTLEKACRGREPRRYVGERWTVELDAERGIANLAWTHPRGYVERKDLEYAEMGTRVFGQPVRPLTCDWATSMTPNAKRHDVDLNDGLVCSRVEPADTGIRLVCREGGGLLSGLGKLSRLKIWYAQTGEAWVAAERRDTESVEIDVCRVGAARLDCQRLTPGSAAEARALWLVDDELQCRIRIPGPEVGGARKVATFALAKDGLRRAGGSMEVSMAEVRPVAD